MSDRDIALIAHLMRRAGFGATYSELEDRAAQGYEATVEDLLHPERSERADEDLYLRYETVWDGNFKTASVPQFFFNMVRTRRPLEEKMALFWHGLFATAGVKVVWSPVMTQQIETFRKHGLGNFRTILVELSKDPAMLFWLDNCQSHGDAPNENYGRELLELFAMGVGNYTEGDVMAASRAFTGWTFRRIACGPYRGVQPTFQFDPADHDYGEKEFLGEKGAFNGEDIIDIVVRQPAAARFIVAKLHNFFVSDEPDEDAIAELGRVYFESGYDIKSVMRGAAAVRLLQGVALRQDQEPRRDDSRHQPPGRRLRAGRRATAVRGGADGPAGRRRRPFGEYGPAAAEPAQRRGLAHRPRVGQQRKPGRACELRRRPSRRRLKARREVHRRTIGLGPDTALPQGAGRRLSGADRLLRRLGPHPRKPRRVRVADRRRQARHARKP